MVPLAERPLLGVGDEDKDESLVGSTDLLGLLAVLEVNGLREALFRCSIVKKAEAILKKGYNERT